MEAIRSLRTRVTAALLCLAPIATACSSSGDRILEVNAEGQVFVILYRDDNLNAAYNNNVDVILEGADVDLRVNGGLGIRPGGVTDSLGLRVFNVTVGRYVVEVGATVLGDSLVVEAGNSPFTVTAGDSITVPVALAYKTISITEARALAIGKTAWVRGIVMNSPNVFGDSTVHIVDDSAAIRTTSVRPGLPLLPGDSVLFLGRRISRDGQPAIELLVIPVIPGVVTPPDPDSISTATAATANAGALDAAFVRITGATISDTVTVNGALTLTVSDGSGPLSVVLSASGNFTNLNQFAPGKIVDATGLLVPDPAGSIWVLKPRSRQDITIQP